MKIAINCRSFLNRQYTGIGRYAYNLVKSLSDTDPNNEYFLYAQKKYFDFKRRVPRIAARNFSVKVDWLGHGIERTLGAVDIYHSPSPDFIGIHQAKIVVTIHDLVYKVYPQGHTAQTIETSEKQLAAIAEKADRIICISQSTRKDLEQHFHVDPKKVSLVYQGVDKNIFFPITEVERPAAQAVAKKRGIRGPFILFVGTIEPRKNLQNLLLAFSDLKRKKLFTGQLLVVGMKGWMMEGLVASIEKLNLKNDVTIPGYITDDQLRYFYNLCEVFVFPSFYEGFGFPIVEAFSCGAAVVTSNSSSCPEIAKDAALTVNPSDPAKIAEAVAKIINDKNLKSDLKAKALKRSQQFSFLKTAQDTLKIYEQMSGSFVNQ